MVKQQCEPEVAVLRQQHAFLGLENGPEQQDGPTGTLLKRRACTRGRRSSGRELSSEIRHPDLATLAHLEFPAFRVAGHRIDVLGIRAILDRAGENSQLTTHSGVFRPHAAIHRQQPPTTGSPRSVTARVTSVRRFTRTVIDLDDAALEEAAKEPAL
jgi:hypothetical protein